jgi:16S rRNA (cytosine967-C5)-methyltransferase
MLTAAQFAHAAQLLAAIVAQPGAADRQMDLHFRANARLGARDRGAIAETVYACLRRFGLPRHLVGEAGPAEAWLAVHLLREGVSARVLETLHYPGVDALAASALAAQLRTLDLATLPRAVRLDLPEWLLARLDAQLGAPETDRLADALRQPAPLDLRTNPLKMDRETVRARLADEGQLLEPMPLSPLGLRRAGRAPLFQTRAFRDGLFEVQDQGSQLLGLLVEARRRETVVDYCAGAGGKTLQLAAQMANTGTLYAFDVAGHRLERIRPRLRRAGVDNVQPVVITGADDPRVRRLQCKADRVLVDAPCSGTGTLRRSPDVKWRPIDLARLAAQQGGILAAAATLVRPGGRLVYATCSLLREENEDVVQGFLGTNAEFRLVPVATVLARRRIALPDTDDQLRLWPHRHGTDGFFAAVLERQAGRC